MGFDWMSFATGFMEHRAEDIKEKKAEARAYKLKQEGQAEDNLATVTKRKGTVNKVLGLTKMLESNGASQKQIQAAIASGADGIATFASKVAAAVEANGGRPLGSADIDTIIRLPDDFTAMDVSTKEYVERSFGSYRPADKKEVAEPEISFWDRLTGGAAMMDTKYKLGTETVAEGMTAAEINAIARQSDYEALVPSTFATFTDFKRFGAGERAGVEEMLMEKTDFLQTMDPEYQAAVATINRHKNPVIQEDIDSRNAALAVIERKKRESFGSIFEEAITQYGTEAVTGLADLMTTYMGEDYVKDLTGAVAPAIAEGEVTNVDTTIEQTGGTVETNNNVTTMAHPNVFADPETGEALKVEFTFDENNTVVSAMAGGEQFEADDAQILYNSFASYTPPGTETPKDVQPKSVREKAIEKFGLTMDDIEEAMDKGEVTESDLQLLVDSGDDMYEYVQENLDPDADEMQYYKLLADWADKNNKILPANMNFLVFQLKKVMSDE